MVWATGMHRPGYDAWREPVSVLSLGPAGAWSRLELLLFAACVAVFGQALARVMPGRRPGWSGRWASRAVLSAAAALVVLGLCVMDDVSYGEDGALVGRRTLEGGVHIVASAALALLLVAHCALSAGYLRRAGAVVWSCASATCALAGLTAVVGYLVVTLDGRGPAGLLERGAIVVMGLHGALVAAWFLRGERVPA